MKRRFLAIAALFGVLAVACGKVGPPVRVRAAQSAAGNPATTENAGASAVDESEEEEKRP